MSKSKTLHGSLYKFYRSSPDVVADRLVALDTGAGPGGIPIEPQDGEIYARSNGNWVRVEVLEAIRDGTIYGRQDGAWVRIPAGGGGFPEAPEDGRFYCRRDADWEELPAYPVIDLDPFVMLDGSRPMTGPLTLSGLPADDGEATNKEYVDTAITDAIDAIPPEPPFVEEDPLSVKRIGDVMSGNLTIHTPNNVRAQLDLISGTTDFNIGTMLRLWNGGWNGGFILELSANLNRPETLGFTIHRQLDATDTVYLRIPPLGDERILLLRPTTLSGDPATPDELTRRAYVDARIAAIPPVDLSPYARLDGATFTGDLILSSDPTVANAAATKRYVDQVVSGSLHLAGAMDATTGICRFGAALGGGTGFLPPAAPANIGYYVVVEVAGTPPPPSPIQVPLNVGDFVISDGTAWNRLAIGGIAITARLVNVNPAAFGADNVQDALESAEGITDAIQIELGDKLDLAGGTMRGFILLHAAPTADMHPATRLYVDTAVTGANNNANTRALRAGDTFTGPVIIQQTGNHLKLSSTGTNRATLLFGNATQDHFTLYRNAGDALLDLAAIDAGGTTRLVFSVARATGVMTINFPLVVPAPTADNHAVNRAHTNAISATVDTKVAKGGTDLDRTMTAGLKFGSAIAAEDRNIDRHIALWGAGVTGFGLSVTNGRLNLVAAANAANMIAFMAGTKTTPTAQVTNAGVELLVAPSANNHAVRRQDMDAADALRVLKAGDSMTADLSFPTDGTGINLNGGSFIKKLAGTGLVIRKSTGNQQVQVEENNGTGRVAIATLTDINTRVAKTGDTLSGGLAFGSVTSTGPRDLSRHLALWGTAITAYGFSVSVDRLNVVAGGAAASRIAFYAGTATTPTAEVSTSGIHVTAAPTVNEHLCNKAYVDAAVASSAWEVHTSSTDWNQTPWSRSRFILGGTHIQFEFRGGWINNWNANTFKRVLLNILPTNKRPARQIFQMGHILGPSPVKSVWVDISPVDGVISAHNFSNDPISPTGSFLDIMWVYPVIPN